MIRMLARMQGGEGARGGELWAHPKGRQAWRKAGAVRGWLPRVDGRGPNTWNSIHLDLLMALFVLA